MAKIVVVRMGDIAVAADKREIAVTDTDWENGTYTPKGEGIRAGNFAVCPALLSLAAPVYL